MKQYLAAAAFGLAAWAFAHLFSGGPPICTSSMPWVQASCAPLVSLHARN